MRAHLREVLLAHGRQLEAQPLVLLSGPGGSGKTTLVRAWRDELHQAGGRMAWLTVREFHRDPILFVEDWVEAIRDVLPAPFEGAEAFGTGLLRAMPRSGAIQVEPIIRLIRRELKQLASPLTVCLDAFEHLGADCPSIGIVDELLRLELPGLSWVIATRGLHPNVSTRMIAEGKAVAIDGQELSLRTDQIQQVLSDAGVQLEAPHVEQLLARTEGWPIAIRFAARALAAVDPLERSRFIERLVRERNLFRYIATELMDGIAPGTQSVLEAASVLGPVEYETLAKAVDSPSASDQIEEAINLGLLQVTGDDVSLHDLLSEWMRVRLQERLDEADWRALHDRLGSVLEDLGHGMGALRLYRAASLTERVASLIAREGHGWVNRGHYDLTDEALQELPDSIRRASPALIAVGGIIEGGRDPDTAIENLKLAIEMYRKAGDQAAEFEAFHELAIVASNENRMAELQGIFRHALTLRRVVFEPRLRGMLMLAVAGGTSVFGRFALSLRLIELAATYDHAPRERAGITLVRSTLRFYRGDWDRVIEDVDARCADEEQRKHGAGFFAIQIRRCAALGLRGIDVAGCREILDQASQMFITVRHRMNRMECEAVRGHLAASVGELESAIEHFLESATLAGRIEHKIAQASAYGLLARTYQRAGQPARAIEYAELTVARLEHYKAKDLRGSRAPFWTPGVVLGAIVHAELVGPDRAIAALQSIRPGLINRELPLCEHAVRLELAKLDELSGNTDASRKNLKEAWRVYRRAGLKDHAPEIDSELWEWSARAAGEAGIETGVDAAERGATEEKLRTTCEIQTLGGLSLRLAGRAVSGRDWRGKTTRRLLVRLLVAEGNVVPRERVEADLWPEASASSARNSMNVGLSRLRNVMEPRRRKGETSPYIHVEGESLGLTEEALAGWDVRRFRAALTELNQATRADEASRAAEAFERFQGCYSGPFVPDMLDDWCLEFRRVLDEEWLQVGRDASAAWTARGNAQLAVAISSLLVKSHRDDEVAWECLAEARLRSGDRSGARRTLEEAKIALEFEVGLAMGSGLARIEDEIREGGASPTASARTGASS